MADLTRQQLEALIEEHNLTEAMKAMYPNNPEIDPIGITMACVNGEYQTNNEIGKEELLEAFSGNDISYYWKPIATVPADASIKLHSHNYRVFQNADGSQTFWAFEG